LTEAYRLQRARRRLRFVVFTQRLPTRRPVVRRCAPNRTVAARSIVNRIRVPAAFARLGPCDAARNVRGDSDSGPSARGGGGGGAAAVTLTEPVAPAALPSASVAVTRAVNAPGAAKAWLGCAPSTPVPSPKSQVVLATGDQTSTGATENASGVATVPADGIASSRSCGGAAS
jgi:hypothetical protein